MRHQIEHVYADLLHSAVRIGMPSRAKHSQDPIQCVNCRNAAMQMKVSSVEHDPDNAKRRQRPTREQRRLLKVRNFESRHRSRQQTVRDHLIRRTHGGVQFVAAMEGLLSSIRPELFMRATVTRVVLLFGPSPSRPGEIYDISLRAKQQAQCVPGVASMLRRCFQHLMERQAVAVVFPRGRCTDTAALLHCLTRSLVAAATGSPEGPVSNGAHSAVLFFWLLPLQ